MRVERRRNRLRRFARVARGPWLWIGIAVVACGAVTYFADGPPRWGAVVVAGFLVLWVSAAWFSKRTLRTIAVLAALGAVLMLMLLGGDAVTSDVNRDTEALCRRALDESSAEAIDLCRRSDFDTSDADKALQERHDAAENLVSIRETRLEAARSSVPTEQATTDPGVKKASDTLADAQERLDAAPPPPVDVDAWELVVDGADRVLEQTLEPIFGADTIDAVFVQLSAIAWILIAVIAGLCYRRLEIRNNRRYGAPIVVTPIAAEGDERRAAFLRDRLRSHIGMAELVEPGPVPGGAAWDEAATTLSDAGLPATKGIGLALRLVRSIAFPPSGVTVTGSCVEVVPPQGATGGSPPAGEQTQAETPAKQVELTITLTTTLEGRFIRSERFSGALEGVIDQAGDFVAADVLAYAALTPLWGRFWGGRGEALTAYRNAQRGHTADKDDLVTALLAAPSNGLLRGHVAQAHDIDGESVKALRLNLANRADYPRFLLGRYRFAASLSMLAEPCHLQRIWWGTGDEKADARDEMAHRLDEAGLLEAAASRWTCWRAGVPHRTNVDDLMALLAKSALGSEERERVVAALLAITWRDVRRMEWRLKIPMLVASMRRQSTRSQWFDLLRHVPQRQRWKGQLRGVRRITELRGIDNHATPDARHRGKLIRKATGEFSSPTISPPALYNGACFFALAAQRATGSERGKLCEQAIDALDRALRTAPNVLVSAEWLKRDPDLETIRDDSRFRQILGWLTAGEKPAPSGCQPGWLSSMKARAGKLKARFLH